MRYVDSHIFPASKTVAAGLFNMKPGALREMHWHPTSEWQYYIGGSARMTVFAAEGEAQTMNFKANDVGFVPAVCGHYVQNTGNDDMQFLAIFKTDQFVEFSLNQWLRRLPVQMTEAETNLSPTAIARIPDIRDNIIPASGNFRCAHRSPVGIRNAEGIVHVGATFGSDFSPTLPEVGPRHLSPCVLTGYIS